MPGPSLTGIPAGYMPARNATGLGSINFIKVTVTNVATRLLDLITAAAGVIPTMDDDRYTFSNPPIQQRTPYHVLFTVPAAAANPIYVTWDNNTAPVVNGPGMEMVPGITYKFESAGPSLMIPGGKSVGLYQVNAKTAFQFIATANTVMQVSFSD